MKHFWIINDLNSTTMFYRNYSDMELDSDLVSGLLSALHNFSEVELHQHGIESVFMGGLNWVYVEGSFEILYIGADEKDVDHNKIRSRLEVLQDAFISEFKLQNNWREEFKGSVGQFEDFNDNCDNHIREWRQAEKVMNLAEMFDLLGIFQQIFNLFINIININFFGESYEEIIDNIQTKAEEIINSKDFSDEKEIKKIKLKKKGWNVFTIKPEKVSDALILQKVLLTLTKEIKGLISKKLGKMLTLDSLSREIFPFVIGNWKLIKKLQIEKKILNIFLL